MISRAKFQLGRVLITPGALDGLEAIGQHPVPYLLRHAKGDWGDLDTEDKQANDDALLSGARILSAYQVTPELRIWLITEAEDDDCVRQSTVLLLPNEY